MGARRWKGAWQRALLNRLESFHIICCKQLLTVDSTM